MEALAGLAGVVIGGLITWVATYSGERRREQALFRAALRLVKVDLSDALKVVTTLQQMDVFPRKEEAEAWIDTTWVKYREVLATHLSAEYWHFLADAYLVLADFRTWIRLEPERPVDDDAKKSLRIADRKIADALISLEEISLDK